MNRILIVVAITFLYSSTSLAVGEDRAPEAIQHTLVTYHEDGFDGTKPNVWVGKYGQLNIENVVIEENTVADSHDRKTSFLGTGIGRDIASLYGTYGVFRSNSFRSNKKDKSTYFALGFTLDELNMDETGTLDSSNDSGLSYGFGVNHSSYNIEYMIYVDEENYEMSAISLGFVSEF